MLNKQNLWFITLFSLILVLGVYYVTIGDESLNYESIVDNSSLVLSITETSALTALQVANDEEVLDELAMYESVILDNYSTVDEKNDAYNSIQTIQNNESKCTEIESLILEKFSLEAFVKIDGDTISVTISSTDHDEELANSIIVEVQNLYETQMYITVKFA